MLHSRVGLHLIAVIALAAGLCSPPALAQAPCSFVLGFAEFASRSGNLAGECAEQQRTIAAPERVTLVGYGPVALQPGDTVQATTHGLLRWNEPLATVEFLTREGIWRIGESGLMLTRWETPTVDQGVPSTADVPVPGALQPAWETLTGLTFTVPDGTETVTMGAWMAEIAAVTGVRIQVAPLPSGTSGRYQAGDNSLTINTALIREDPRALASVLAHELTHARQVYAGRGARSDCVPMEVEAHVTGSLVWVSFWTDGAPPTRTALERELTRVAQVAASEGEPGIYRLVVGTPGYQDQCGLWVPEGGQQAPPAEPARPTSKLTPELAARCSNIGFELATQIAPHVDAANAVELGQSMTRLCRLVVAEHGEAGYLCFAPAARDLVRSAPRVRAGSTKVLVDAFSARLKLCTGSLPR